MREAVCMDGATIGIITAIVGCFIGLAGWLSGRDKKIANDSEFKGAVKTQLTSIDTGVKGVCVEVKSVQTTLNEHGERITAVASSVDQAHKRIDRIERDGG